MAGKLPPGTEEAMKRKHAGLLGVLGVSRIAAEVLRQESVVGQRGSSGWLLLLVACHSTSIFLAVYKSEKTVFMQICYVNVDFFLGLLSGE